MAAPLTSPCKRGEVAAVAAPHAIALPRRLDSAAHLVHSPPGTTRNSAGHYFRLLAILTGRALMTRRTTWRSSWFALAITCLSSPAAALDLDDLPVGTVQNFGPNLQTTAAGVCRQPEGL